MSEIGMTTMNVKKINKNKVYSYIYKENSTSKMQIVQNLKMGLSTVSQNLKLLEDEGLIEREGFFESTGGRKANAIRIVRTARVAVGIGILKDKILLAIIDLYGDVVSRTEIAVAYSPEESYYKDLGKKLDDFILSSHIAPESILGVSIATQGVISTDGESVSYGAIMNNSDMKLSDFEKYIPYPCRLVHDSKAAACLELWKHKELQNALFLLLNPNLGGAIISAGQVQQGTHMRSGLIEHLCITTDGPLCYCGKRGCLETYCSASSLEETAQMKIPEFFVSMRKQSSPLKHIWTDYLNHLAFAIRNLNIIIDGDVIISGYLAPYLQEEDIEYLLNQINASTPFPLTREQIILGTHGQYSPTIGGALTYIEQFIASI